SDLVATLQTCDMERDVVQISNETITVDFCYLHPHSFCAWSLWIAALEFEDQLDPIANHQIADRLIRWLVERVRIVESEFLRIREPPRSESQEYVHRAV